MGSLCRLLYYVILAELTCLLLGYHLSVISGAMLVLADTFHLDIIWQQLIVTASAVGGALSLFPAGYLVHKFGRKKLILGANVIICTGSVITAVSNAKEVILLGRFITGIGISIPSYVVPMYISECAPANIRGRLGSLTHGMINGGIFLSAVMGGAFNAVQSGWSAYSRSIIVMAGFASGNAAWLATIPFAIQFLATLITTCFVDKIGRKILFVGAHVVLLIALIVLGVGFYLSSTDSPTVSPTIVETYSNGTNITGCQFRTCHDCINDRCGFCYDVIERATCIPVIDNGSAVGGRCLKGNTFNHTDFTLETDVCPTSYSWIPVLGLSLFELAFGSGPGVIWIIISEVFPLWARSACSSIACAAIWIFQIIASMTFLSLANAISIHGIFWLYAAVALLAVIYTYIFLPETRGKRLEDIEKLFMSPEEQRRNRKGYDG